MSIEIQNLKKHFKDVTAVDDLTLEFKNGVIYGLLGRNGAGKSTLINLITNHIFANEGTIRIDGENAVENDQVQNRIYCMSEKTYYPEDTRVNALFKWTAMFYKNFDMDYAMELTKKFGLNIKAKTKSLSTGYLSICKLILTMASGADYLIFDEPVLGLDANHRELFYRELMELYVKKEPCILISTHLIEEVAGVIEHLVIIKEGRLLMNCPVEDALQMGYTVTGSQKSVEDFCSGKQVMNITNIGGLSTACIYGKKPPVPQGLEAGKMDLQQLFIQLTNA